MTAESRLGKQLEDKLPPQVVASDPVPEGVCGDHDRLSFLFHRGNSGKTFLAQDGIGGEDAGFSVPKPVQGDLPPGLANLVNPNNARDEQSNRIDLVALDENIMTSRVCVRKRRYPEIRAAGAGQRAARLARPWRSFGIVPD